MQSQLSFYESKSISLTLRILFQVINDEEWLKNVFVPTVQKRGAAVLEARKARYCLNAYTDNLLLILDA